MKKILFFLALFLILFAMLSWSFNALGIIDVKTTVSNLANSTPVVKDYIITQGELESLAEKNNSLENKLSQKDIKIAELEKQIEDLKQKLVDRDKMISNLESDYESLSTKEQNHEVRLEKIASIYGRMEPEAAAAVIQELNNNLAVEVLTKLKDEQAAAILEAMPQRQAAQFTSQLGLE